ncbi:MAG TPA: DUF1464 family protein [Gemmatimonadales bacterium]|nr:DUF1464 family protein [Gemmatimonadales bacterium]
MTRVAGIDPGTVTLDACGLEDGRVFLDASWPTAELMADPRPLIDALLGAGSVDLLAGPSGYGLPLCRARDVTDDDLRLAFLAPPGATGGIGGLRALARRLDQAGLPLVLTPGVIHLETVPVHRKLNRVDLGTADKVCAAALAIGVESERRARRCDEISLIMLELGGAFTAGLAVEQGRIVDGLGGTSGPIGWRAAGALDGEVAFLAGEVSKSMLFDGGVERIAMADPRLRTVALDAYVEGAIRAARALHSSAPSADTVLLSGRHAVEPEVGPLLRAALADIGEVRPLTGFATRAKQGAQGAALLADGLAGGRHRELVERLGIREARGTVLDHLYVIPPAAARRRLGLADA